MFLPTPCTADLAADRVEAPVATIIGGAALGFTSGRLARIRLAGFSMAFRLGLTPVVATRATTTAHRTTVDVGLDAGHRQERTGATERQTGRALGHIDVAIAADFSFREGVAAVSGRNGHPTVEQGDLHGRGP